jgi:putative transposase
VLPHASLLDVDARLAQAAAVPVITPETIVCDRGRAFLSDTFRRACHTLEISLQPAHPDTPTDKPHIERTLGSVASMFAQFLPGHKGRSTEHRGKEPEQQAVWSIHQIQALLEEWIVARWQTRPHDGLRDPLMPGRPLSPNEKPEREVCGAGRGGRPRPGHAVADGVHRAVAEHAPDAERLRLQDQPSDLRRPGPG